MISKCANSECSRPFHYFREGKLFSREIREGGHERGVLGMSDFKGKTSRTEFFWLCAECCKRFTLNVRISDGKSETVLEPLASSRKDFRQDEEEIRHEAA